MAQVTCTGCGGSGYVLTSSLEYDYAYNPPRQRSATKMEWHAACQGSGFVFGPDPPPKPRRPRNGPIGDTKPQRILSPEELREAAEDLEREKVRDGARLIAAVLGGLVFFLTITSSLSFGVVLGLMAAVVAAAYFVFVGRLAVISSGLMGLIEFVFGAVKFTLNAGVFLLGAAVILYVLYLLVASST